jgi:hypothetical protein
VLIEHRKLNDHSVEVVAVDLTSPQWHYRILHTKRISLWHWILTQAKLDRAALR